MFYEASARQGLIKIILDEQKDNKEVLVRYLELIHIKISLDNGDYSKRKENISETSDQFVDEYCQIEDDEEVILETILGIMSEVGRNEWFNFCWLMFLFASVFTAADSIIFSFKEEEFSPDIHLYESKQKCIHSERKDCSLKYIKAYISTGGRS